MFTIDQSKCILKHISTDGDGGILCRQLTVILLDTILGLLFTADKYANEEAAGHWFADLDRQLATKRNDVMRASWAYSTDLTEANAEEVGDWLKSAIGEISDRNEKIIVGLAG